MIIINYDDDINIMKNDINYDNVNIIIVYYCYLDNYDIIIFCYYWHHYYHNIIITITIISIITTLTLLQSIFHL